MKGKDSRNKPEAFFRFPVFAVFLVLGAGMFPGAVAQIPRLMPPPVAADGTLSFADLVEKVSPSVVSVMVEREVEKSPAPRSMEEFFQYRFNDPQFEDRFNGEPRRMEAQGSGFLIDPQGHIVTNNHVVDGADRVRVRLYDGREIGATVVGADSLTDLAVLKVDPPEGLPFVNFADDVNLRVGDWVLAVGNPFGLGGTVTSGIVSAIGGRKRENQYIDYIQIDAPINRGNSGGPTFDLKGRVVGVNTAIFSPTGGSVGIGFAIPARVARETVSQLIADGSVTRGWLGIHLQEVTTEIAAALGLGKTGGVLVAEVLDGTPAQEAGLEDGDVIIRVDRNPVTSPNELSRIVASLVPGSRIRIRVLREGRERNIDVTLGRRENDGDNADATSGEADGDVLFSQTGLRVSPLDDTLRQRYRISGDVRGVVVTAVRPGSPAGEAGLRPGVVILEADGKAVESRSDLLAGIEKAGESDRGAILLRMQYGENRQFAALSLED